MCMYLHRIDQRSCQRAKISCRRKAVCSLEGTECVVGIETEFSSFLSWRTESRRSKHKTMRIEKLLEEHDIRSDIFDPVVDGKIILRRVRCLYSSRGALFSGR